MTNSKSKPFYKNHDALASQKAFRRGKYTELWCSVKVNELNVEHLIKLSAEGDNEEGRYAIELSRCKELLANFTKQCRDLGKTIAAKPEADKDALIRWRNWLRDHLSTIEHEHMAQKEFADHPEWYKGTEGFKSGEFHAMKCHEFEIRHGIATKALKEIEPTVLKIENDRKPKDDLDGIGKAEVTSINKNKKSKAKAN